LNFRIITIIPITIFLGILSLICFYFSSNLVFIYFFIESSFPQIEWGLFYFTIQKIFLINGILFFILGLITYYIEFNRSINLLTILIKTIQAPKSIFIKAYHIYINNSPIYLIFLYSTIIIGISFRIYNLQLPITWDAAYTYLNFLDEGISEIFNYKTPNNHQFYSIITKLIINILNDNIYTLRLAAIFFGSINLILIFFIVKYISKKSMGVISSLLMSTLPIIIHYDSVARGYSIITTCSLLLLLFAFKFIKTNSLKVFIPMIFISAIGIFTLPTFIFPFFGTTLWFFYHLFVSLRWSFKKTSSILLIFNFCTFFLSWIFYSPTILFTNGINKLIKNKYIIGEEFGVFPNDIPQLFYNISKLFFGQLGVFIVIGIILILLMLLRFNIHKTFSQFIFFQLISIIIIICVLQTIPPERTLLFILPYFIIGIDIFISTIIIKFIPQIFNTKIVLLSMLIFQIITLIIINSKGKMSSYRGFIEAPVIIEYLAQTPKNSKYFSTYKGNYQSLKYYSQINQMNYPELIDTIKLSKLIHTIKNPNIYLVTNKRQKIAENNKLFYTVFENGSTVILKRKIN